MEGSGRMLVTAVGKNSQAGIIYSLLNNMHGDLPEPAVQLNSVGSPNGKIPLPPMSSRHSNCFLTEICFFFLFYLMN